MRSTRRVDRNSRRPSIPGATASRSRIPAAEAALSIAPQNGSEAASDLGLTTATGNTIQGDALIAGLDSVLVRSLNGGSGVPLGTISITDRSGHSGDINLSGATSLSDITNAINTNTLGIGVTASLNTSGTGIQITDSSGGTGNLIIGDVSSTTAAALGIAGTFTNTQTDTGVNLQRKYVSLNTSLSSYNNGAGVSLGEFQIQNSTGAVTDINLAQGTYNTIGDVINAINSKNGGVTASINTTGNGIQLTDTAGGSGKLTVTDLAGGTAAADLNIAGTATGTTIDGAEQKTISVSATDTLASLQTKINQLGFGVTASIVNDGSSGSPYRLSLTAVNSGEAGRVIVDSGTTNLGFRNLVNAQDAAVFYGGSGGTQPLLITSNTNQLTNVIKGVTVNLVSAEQHTGEPQRHARSNERVGATSEFRDRFQLARDDHQLRHAIQHRQQHRRHSPGRRHDPAGAGSAVQCDQFGGSGNGSIQGPCRDRHHRQRQRRPHQRYDAEFRSEHFRGGVRDRSQRGAGPLQRRHRRARERH